jgi:hypothetical protein
VPRQAKNANPNGRRKSTNTFSENNPAIMAGKMAVRRN